MDTIETGRLCKNVEFAASRIRTRIDYWTETMVVLDYFWSLQDSLSRLIGAVDNECGQVGQRRGLIRYVAGAIESQRRRRATIPAVRDASDKINALLIRLERATGDGSTVST